ncbi:unannotated protein [freshwater metagenome]|uniref:Unannotated protein n=1 Tax=freshwater metagenome TaxID=449393 RepID=A0A6J7EPG0_9ZZZZ
MGVPGGNHVHSNPLGRVVDCRALRESVHAVLARCVRRCAKIVRFGAVDGRDVDDRTCAPAEHRRDLELHAQPDRPQVGVHDLVPLIFLNVGERNQDRAGDASVVHRAIKPPVRVQGAVDQSLHIGTLGDVRAHEECLPAGCFDGVLHLETLVHSASGEHYLGSLACELHGCRSADPGIGASYHHDLVVERSHHLSRTKLAEVPHQAP